MPALTRRRDPEAHQESWHVLYDDVHVGSIGMRSGVPTHADQWRWSVGFYPLSHRGEREDGTAPDFFRARVDFGAAWSRLLPKITDADLAEYRRQRAHTAWKYRMWETGCKLPTQVASGRSHCYCGVEIDSRSIGPHIDAEHTT